MFSDVRFDPEPSWPNALSLETMRRGTPVQH